jgi:hypothetical protein
MTNPQDFTKAFTDMMAGFPTDTTAMTGMFRNSAALGEKMSKVALDAAERSAELSNKWTRETLSKLGQVTVARQDPADYTKAMTDFASASIETAAEHVAAFAEIAKKAQLDTVELLMSAGKDAQEDASAAMKKAGAEMTGMARKTASKAA